LTPWEHQILQNWSYLGNFTFINNSSNVVATYGATFTCKSRKMYEILPERVYNGSYMCYWLHGSITFRSQKIILW
jgi:hypothetical protein